MLSHESIDPSLAIAGSALNFRLADKGLGHIYLSKSNVVYEVYLKKNRRVVVEVTVNQLEAALPRKQKYGQKF